jgi:hypothetical protein
MTDAQLESAARDYIWVAKAIPEPEYQRLAEIVEEARRRGKPEIVEHARKELPRPIPRYKRGAAGKR